MLRLEPNKIKQASDFYILCPGPCCEDKRGLKREMVKVEQRFSCLITLNYGKMTYALTKKSGKMAYNALCSFGGIWKLSLLFQRITKEVASMLQMT